MCFKRMTAFMIALLIPLFAFATSTAAKTLDGMREASGRLETMMEDPNRKDESVVLQETWDVLHNASLSDEGQRGTDEFMHEFFTLTDTYMKADNSGAAMDVFSAYYEDKKTQVTAYAKKPNRKTKLEVIERVLAAEKEYGFATDSSEREQGSPVRSGTR